MSLRCCIHSSNTIECEEKVSCGDLVHPVHQVVNRCSVSLVRWV